MSRLSKRAWYERVNAAWPGHIPPLTADEAVRAARRLYRFAFRRPWKGKVIATSGNRYGGIRWIRKGGAVVGRALVVNPDRGWHNMIHILSHYAAPGSHGRDHAIMERRMIHEVVRRGWLDGKLKRERAPVQARDPRAERYQRVMARIERWEQKKRRAENALRRLNRTRRYYERLQESAA